jgi:Rps23 Pro-64 3,4-dihydroxylase Tpa1-like proline 4-hydroxylase
MVKRMNRTQIAEIVKARLTESFADIQAQFQETSGDIGYFYVDQFPSPEGMKLKKSLREYKYIAAQMDQYDPILEEAIYAFQDPGVVEIVKQVCGMASAYPDEHLYAGGISMMGKDQFLNPHLDNSHDKDRERWRVLNLLYYVAPDWRRENGGNLELWPAGVAGKPITIDSRFNRLAVMATHGKSWHSVSPIAVDRFRCCVSNYYFADEPLRDDDSFHVTSFRGRPEQPVRDLVLRADAATRMLVRKVKSDGVVENPHVYKR